MKTILVRLAAVAAAASLLLASCHEDPEGPTPDDPQVSTNPVLNVTIPSDGITISSADVHVETSHVTHFAHVLKYAEESYDTDPALVFEDGTVMACNAEGDTTFTLSDLEGLTEYVLYVAARDTTGSIMDTLVTVPFTTSDYTDIVTITKQTYDGVELYVKVPAWTDTDSSGYRYAIASLPTYMQNKSGWFINADSELLLYNGQMVLTESGKLVYNNDNVYLLDENGEPVLDDWGSPIYIHDPFVPGEPLVFLVGEFGWSEGDPAYGQEPGWLDAKFDYEGWVNGGMLLEDEASYWTGLFSKVETRTLLPEVLDADLNVEITDLSPISATINIAPDEEVYQYCVVIIDEATLQMMMPYLNNNEEYLQWFTTSYFAMMAVGLQTFQGNTSISLADLYYEVIPETVYHVMVTGMSDSTGRVQNFYHETFSTPAPTEPAPIVEVKGIPNPSGEESPYEVWFNVKAPNSDVASAKYVCNYEREMASMLDMYSYADLLDFYGNELDSESVAQINSSEGLNLSFSSREDAVTMLAVMVENSEGTSNADQLNEENSTAVAENRTIREPDAERVESSLFADLEGEWTAKATVLEYDYNEEAYVEKEYVSKVEIMGSVELPETLHDSVYTIYSEFGFDKAATDEIYATFRDEAAIYNDKTRGQNRVLCLGFNFDQNVLLNVADPYDLFTSRTYNAYDEAAIFYDFGPKWNLQIAAGDEVTVPVNINKIYPMDNWQFSSAIYMIGLSENDYIGYGSDNELIHFPVTVSDDKNTLTIGSTEMFGVEYYPSYCYLNGGYAYGTVRFGEDIVLTRGWDESAAVKTASVPSAAARFFSAGNAIMSVDFTPVTRPYSRTLFLREMEKVEYNEVEMSVPTVDEVKANLEEYFSRNSR